MNYIRILRRGAKHTRVLLADGSTRIVPTSSLDNTRPDILAKTFGLEFEFLIPTNNVNTMHTKLRELLGNRYLDSSNHYCSNYSCWQMSTDGSLIGGNGYSTKELKSPILAWTDESYAEVKAVLSILNSLGGKVNTTCGTHVHIGSFTQRITPEQNKLLYTAYGRWENALFDAITSRSRRNNRFCRTCKINFERDRYHKLNPCSLDKHSTIEFRQHQGTLNATKILNWAKLCKTWLEMILKTEDLSVPSSTEVAIERLMSMGTDETLKTYISSRVEDFLEA